MKTIINLALITMFLALTVCAQELTQSMAAPPSADLDSVVPNPTIITHANAKDHFGAGISDRYLPVQVTVSNNDTTASFLVSNIIFSFDPEQCQAATKVHSAFDVKRCLVKFDQYFGYPVAFAPATQEELLGVNSVRTLHSGRATFFRALSFAVQMASIVTPLKLLGRDARVGVGIVAASGAPALNGLFPDQSSAQLQHLNNQSYNGNVVIGPNQSATFVIFISADLVFSKTTWKNYKSEKGSVEGLEMKQLMELFATVGVTGAKITTTQSQTFRSNTFTR
jgi:hypothetical protein